jgi:hypothetical protein
MLVGVNSRRMVTIFPEGPVPPFPSIVFLGHPSGDQLHALSNHVLACVFNKQMNMVRCDNVIEHTKSRALLGFEQPMKITAPILCKLEEKFSF